MMPILQTIMDILSQLFGVLLQLQFWTLRRPATAMAWPVVVFSRVWRVNGSQKIVIDDPLPSIVDQSINKWQYRCLRCYCFDYRRGSRLADFGHKQGSTHKTDTWQTGTVPLSRWKAKFGLDHRSGKACNVCTDHCRRKALSWKKPIKCSEYDQLL